MHPFTPSWPPPPGSLHLFPDEVHVWSAALECLPHSFVRLVALLSEEERERAGRYRSAKTRDEFQFARGLLRALLGRYLDVDPRALAFRLGPQGKPELAEPSGLHFNVSHSHGVILLAVTRLAEVGVDVERLRPITNDVELAERFFCPAEAAAMRELEDERRCRAFFHIWTQKEAYLKAGGLGLTHGLERVEVNTAPEEPARVVRIDGAEEPARRWSLRTLEPAPEHLGAVAMHGHEFRLCCWYWPGE